MLKRKILYRNSIEENKIDESEFGIKLTLSL